MAPPCSAFPTLGENDAVSQQHIPCPQQYIPSTQQAHVHPVGPLVGASLPCKPPAPAQPFSATRPPCLAVPRPPELPGGAGAKVSFPLVTEKRGSLKMGANSVSLSSENIMCFLRSENHPLEEAVQVTHSLSDQIRAFLGQDLLLSPSPEASHSATKHAGCSLGGQGDRCAVLPALPLPQA